MGDKLDHAVHQNTGVVAKTHSDIKISLYHLADMPFCC